MSEPSSDVPPEAQDEQVETSDGSSEEPTEVSLDVDEAKIEAWDEVKGDYQVEPEGEPVPNSMETADVAADDEDVPADPDA